MGGGDRKSFRDVKSYRRRRGGRKTRRWRAGEKEPR